VETRTDCVINCLTRKRDFHSKTISQTNCASFNKFTVVLGPRQFSRYCDWLRAGRSGIESRWGRDFFAHVQTGPGAQPASCTMGTGSFPGVKQPGRGADQPLLLVQRSTKSRAIRLPPSRPSGLLRDTFIFLQMFYMFRYLRTHIPSTVQAANKKL
jgi:hypothetical protein